MIVTVNGLPVLEAIVTVSIHGCWTADLSVDADDQSAVAGALTLAIDDGEAPVTLAGFARRAIPFLGRVGILAVGGAGGLAQVLDGRHYRDVVAAIPAQDIASAAGESIDPASDLAAELPHWTRLRGTGGQQLEALAGEVGHPWRMTLDGKILVAEPTWADAGLVELDVLDRNPVVHALTVARFVDAGTTVLGEKVERARFEVGRGSPPRSTLWLLDG